MDARLKANENGRCDWESVEECRHGAADDQPVLCHGAPVPDDFYMRVPPGSPIPEMEPSDEDAPEAPRSNGWRSRVIGSARAKTGSFAITVNRRHTIGVIVAVDLERGVPVWNAIAGTRACWLLHHNIVTAAANRGTAN